jgi:hypothetical protein
MYLINLLSIRKFHWKSVAYHVKNGAFFVIKNVRKINRKQRFAAGTPEAGSVCRFRRRDTDGGGRDDRAPKKVANDGRRDGPHLIGTIFLFCRHSIIFYFLKAVLGGIRRN